MIEVPYSQPMKAGFGVNPLRFAEFTKSDQKLNYIVDIMTQPTEHEI